VQGQPKVIRCERIGVDKLYLGWLGDVI